MKEYDKAAEYIEQAVSLYENDKSDLLPHTLFTLTQIYFKMKDIEKAFILYKKGIEKAQAINDDVLVAEFNYLKALYIDSIDKRTVFQTFSVDNVMYPDLEELALDTANYCKEIGQYENSTTFFDVMVDGGCPNPNTKKSVYMKFKLALATLSVVVGLAVFSGFSSSNDKEFHEAKRNITSIQPTKFNV
ncbi:tetratricopeptide repeat protein [Bacillus mojavensis]|uniref:tetratricopeptide repeat protein n=1 Tax=Bacillus mojavensis TaxID=72360 RepID=UPI002DB5D3DB|nr:tetratricopeptide repeat protein [Bacillus mojavensis]MEC1672262.1 tetratricopeptide repeat protein [Bacillus mojavensis]